MIQQNVGEAKQSINDIYNIKTNNKFAKQTHYQWAFFLKKQVGDDPD